MKDSATNLAIDLIRLDGGTQPRAKIDEDTVADYAAIWQASNGHYPFDKPCEVFHDGTDYWCTDGFHRILGAHRAKKASIPCVIHKGTVRDAIIYAAKCNSQHGLRRSAADKRHIVVRFLKDEEWSTKSNRWIAEVCDVSHWLVDEIRKQLYPPEQPADSVGRTANSHPKRRGSNEGKRQGKDGKQYKEAKSSTTPQKPEAYKPKNRDSVHDDTEQCPNCGCQWWKPVKGGHDCDNCCHPLGEPVGDRDEESEKPLGDLEQRELSGDAEKELKKARSAIGVLVRYCEGMKLAAAKPHLTALAKIVGK